MPTTSVPPLTGLTVGSVVVGALVSTGASVTCVVSPVLPPVPGTVVGVVAADGSTFQVEAGHQRYYKHKRDDSYLGTDSSVDVADLRARFGVNPDDYEEVRVKR